MPVTDFRNGSGCLAMFDLHLYPWLLCPERVAVGDDVEPAIFAERSN